MCSSTKPQFLVQRMLIKRSRNASLRKVQPFLEGAKVIGFKDFRKRYFGLWRSNKFTFSDPSLRQIKAWFTIVSMEALCRLYVLVVNSLQPTFNHVSHAC